MKGDPDTAFDIIQALSVRGMGLDGVTPELKEIFNDINAVARYRQDVINFDKKPYAPPKYTVVDRSNGEHSAWVGYNRDALLDEVRKMSNDPVGEYVLLDQWGNYWEFDGTPAEPPPKDGG